MQLATSIEQIVEHWGNLIVPFRIFGAVAIVITYLLLLVLAVVFAVKVVKECSSALDSRYSHRNESYLREVFPSGSCFSSHAKFRFCSRYNISHKCNSDYNAST